MREWQDKVSDVEE